MDIETEKYFRNYQELFRCDGWKQLLEELQTNAFQINSVELAKDNEDLFFRKGQLVVLANILNLETQIENAQEAAESEEDTDASASVWL